jgi:hypothetical protein
MALDASATEQTIGGMEDLLLILAILATAAAILQIVARLGLPLGSRMQAMAIQYSHLKETIILACVLWAAWYVLAGAWDGSEVM